MIWKCRYNCEEDISIFNSCNEKIASQCNSYIEDGIGGEKRERAKRKNDAKEEVYLFRLTKLLSFR